MADLPYTRKPNGSSASFHVKAWFYQLNVLKVKSLDSCPSGPFSTKKRIGFRVNSNRTPSEL